MVLLLISNPYLLRSSFVYYMFNYGLLFATIGIYFYFFSNNKHKIILAHLFWGLAVLCQQWMLIIIFSIFLLEFNLFLKRELEKKLFIKGVIYKLFFLLPSFILFSFWQGLTHPNFQFHKLDPSFNHLTGTLANYGIVGIFILLFNFKKYFKVQYLPLIYFLPIIYLTIPSHSEHLGFDVITGVASQLSIQLQKYFSMPYKINMFFLAAIGMMVLIAVISKNSNNFSFFLKNVILGFLIAFSSSTALGAVHIFVSFPFLLLAFNSDLKEKKLLENTVLICFYLMSIFYVIYYSLFKVKGFNL